MPSHRLQQHRRILRRPRHRPDPVQRRRIRHQSTPRHPPIRRLHPRNPAERRRLPDRSTRVRPQRHNRLPSRHHRRRSPTRPTRHALQIPRIPRHPQRRILRRRPHRKFIAVHLPERNRPSRSQPRHRRRIPRRYIPAQHLRRTRQRLPSHIDHILHRHRYPPQRQRKIRRIRRLQRPLHIPMQISANHLIPRRNRRLHTQDDVPRTDLPSPQPPPQLHHRAFIQSITHNRHSTTLGTRN